MTFAQSVRKCLSNYATFSGRASRSEYWWFVLFTYLVIIAIAILGGIVAGLTSTPSNGSDIERTILAQSPLALAIFGLDVIFFLAMLMPTWAAGVRRFHDRDLSGWVYLGLILAGLIPYVGFLASIGSFVITVLSSVPGPNRFGPHPQAGSADVFA